MDESADLVGRVIANKYAVRSVIGSGAMGTVYRAQQIALDKIVALKVLNDDLRDDAEFVARFHTEARAASRLDHPNSTRVLDFGEEPDGLLYIAMELLEGRTLAELLDDEFPLRPERVASILSQALAAIGAAHKIGILHRDLKPDNIVVLERRDDEDRPVDVVKVCDFGIAKLEGAAEVEGVARAESRAASAMRSPTRAGIIVGTPQYMSPEQARGEPLDPRSDLYALGVVLFELLTRRAPFDDGTPAEVLWKHATEEPPTPSSLHPNVDPRLEAICVRALRKDRDQRFANAREMRSELKPILENGDPAAPPSRASAPREHVSAPTISATSVGLAPPTPRARRRVLWLAPLALSGVAAVAFALHRDARKPPSVARPPATSTPRFTVAATAPITATATATATVTATATATATAPPTVTLVHLAHLTHAAEPPPPATTIDPEPPPPPATTVAPFVPTAPPPPAPMATKLTLPSRPAVVRADPALAHVDLGRIHTDRVGSARVESVLRHVDFTSCYRAAVARGEQAAGTATLALDMDEDRVAHASVGGGGFSPALRSCVAQLVVGRRIPDADTGGASAKVELRFSLR